MRGENLRLKCLAHLRKVKLGIYSESSHGLVPWELFTELLVPWETGKFKCEVFAHPTEVQVGMYSDSSYGLVPWELLS